MLVFEERIREMHELLPVYENGHTRRPTQDDVARFRELYFVHSRELNTFANKYYLESHIRNYRYVLFNAATAYKNNQINNSRAYLNKALRLARIIAGVHSIFPISE